MVPKKRKPTTRAEHAALRFSFPGADDTAVLSLIDVATAEILQYADMVRSDDAELRKIGRQKLREAATFVAQGRYHLAAQKIKAGHERDTIKDGNDEGTSLTKILKKLLKQHGQDSKPGELWEHYVSDLERRGMSPKEETALDKNDKKIKVVRYVDGIEGGRKTDINSFRATLSQIRKTKSES